MVNSEACYVRTIAQRHEASDGRGLSQLQRSRYNYQMLNFTLHEWMPWHGENYDFSTVDINKYFESLGEIFTKTLNNNSNRNLMRHKHFCL